MRTKSCRCDYSCRKEPAALFLDLDPEDPAPSDKRQRLPSRSRRDSKDHSAGGSEPLSRSVWPFPRSLSDTFPCHPALATANRKMGNPNLDVVPSSDTEVCLLLCHVRRRTAACSLQAGWGRVRTREATIHLCVGCPPTPESWAPGRAYLKEGRVRSAFVFLKTIGPRSMSGLRDQRSCRMALPGEPVECSPRFQRAAVPGRHVAPRWRVRIQSVRAPTREVPCGRSSHSASEAVRP